MTGPGDYGEPTDPNNPPPHSDWAAPSPQWVAGQPSWTRPEPAPSAPVPPVFVEQRTVRFHARPLPLAGGTYAGAGVALAVLGVIIWAGDYAVSGLSSDPFGGGSTRNWLGIVLSLVVVALGYALVAIGRGGPLSTAGVAASALGVPTALGFLTLSVTGGSPVDLDVMFLLSIGVWLLSYLVLPGARGHAFYLGAGAVALWVYLVIKIEPNLFGLPFLAFERAFAGPGSTLVDPTQHLDQLAVLSLLMGAVYYLLAFIFDQRGLHGLATPFAVAGLPTVLGGIAFAAHSLRQTGVGIVLVVVGAVLSVYGARAGRRFTSWAWGAGLAAGVLMLVAKAAPDNRAAAGIALVVIGAVLVVVGATVSAALREREYPAERPPTVAS